MHSSRGQWLVAIRKQLLVSLRYGLDFKKCEKLHCTTFHLWGPAPQNILSFPEFISPYLQLIPIPQHTHARLFAVPETCNVWCKNMPLHSPPKVGRDLTPSSCKCDFL